MRDAGTAPRRRGTARAVLVLSWLLATVLGGVVAWSAVTVVAGARGGDGAGILSQADVTTRLAEARATASPAATPSATDVPPASTAPATPPATDPAGAPPPTAPAPPSAPGTREVARTWDVTGGQVAAACAGATIRLLFATPADGWTVEVQGTGPQRVEVRLTRDGQRTRVRAECLAGTPELTADGADDDAADDTGGSGGGGDGDDGGDDGQRDDSG